MTTRLSLLTLVWWCFFSQAQADTIFDLDRTEAMFDSLRQGALSPDTVTLQVEDGIVDALIDAGVNVPATAIATDAADVAATVTSVAGTRADPVRPAVLRLDPDFWAITSTEPGSVPNGALLGDLSNRGNPAARARDISEGLLLSTTPEGGIAIEDDRDYFLAMTDDFVPETGTVLLFLLGGALFCGLVAQVTRRREWD